MRKLILLVSLILICGSASAAYTNFTNFTAWGSGWTANNDTYKIVMWNTTGTTHKWLSTGNTSSVIYLVVSGGGGGAIGGGGAGGTLSGSMETIGEMSIVVGTGGTGAHSASGTRGGNSSFGNVTSNITPTGGGVGVGYATINNGGSGGGGGSGAGGANVTGQGFYGGTGDGSHFGVGGGGAGAPGPGTPSGAGGAGQSYSILTDAYAGVVSSGTRYIAGGGGGGNNGAGGTGGVGGGGNGSNTAATAGIVNTGGGGGGAYTSGPANGGSGIVIIEYALPGVVQPINASFTQAPNPSSTGQSVTFTDTSTGSPTTWNWTFGDIGAGNTSTSHNPTHTYTTAGNYTVLLNVSNSTGSFSTASAWHNVTNASAFYTQDVWMEGQYTVTFPITDSTTGAAINNATVLSSSGGSAISNLTGYAVLTEGFGVYTGYFSATGYASKSISFVVDQDTTMAVQLTPSTPQSQNTNIIYSPHQVRVYTVDAYGVPLIGTNITINYIASTLPSTDTNWLINAYGIDAAVAADMVNSSVAMMGTSGDDGSNTFTLFGSLTYGITLTNATVGANCYKKLAPIDASYRIYCPITGQTAVNNTLTAVNTSKLTFYKLNTSSYYNLSMIYEDQTGYTTNLSFNVYDYSAGRTLVYTKNWTGIGTAQVIDNYTVHIPLGKEYQWQYNATKV